MDDADNKGQGQRERSDTPLTGEELKTRGSGIDQMPMTQVADDWMKAEKRYLRFDRGLRGIFISQSSQSQVAVMDVVSGELVLDEAGKPTYKDAGGLQLTLAEVQEIVADFEKERKEENQEKYQTEPDKSVPKELFGPDGLVQCQFEGNKDGNEFRCQSKITPNTWNVVDRKTGKTMVHTYGPLKGQDIREGNCVQWPLAHPTGARVLCKNCKHSLKSEARDLGLKVYFSSHEVARSKAAAEKGRAGALGEFFAGAQPRGPKPFRQGGPRKYRVEKGGLVPLVPDEGQR